MCYFDNWTISSEGKLLPNLNTHQTLPISLEDFLEVTQILSQTLFSLIKTPILQFLFEE